MLYQLSYTREVNDEFLQSAVTRTPLELSVEAVSGDRGKNPWAGQTG